MPLGKRGKPFDDRDDKGGGLPGPGLRAANDITPRKRRRDGPLLDGSWCRKPSLRQGLDQYIGQTERVKTYMNRRIHYNILSV